MLLLMLSRIPTSSLKLSVSPYMSVLRHVGGGRGLERDVHRYFNRNWISGVVRGVVGFNREK